MGKRPLQANAEPDMRQTGQRLKGLIVSLVTGVLQLLLGPDAYQEVGYSLSLTQLYIIVEFSAQVCQ